MVEKTYLALVRGGRKSFSQTSGEIREALDFVGGRVSIGTTAKAKFAATDWELLGSSVSPLCVHILVRRRLMQNSIVEGANVFAQIEIAHRTEASVAGSSRTLSTQ